MQKYRSGLAALVVGAFTIVASISGAQAADATAQTLASPCAGCHGQMGTSGGPATPTIAGMTEQYFLDSMNSYKSGARKGTIMDRIAKGYTDSEVKAMAKLFAAQKFGRPDQMTDAAVVAKGKALHIEYCDSCHEQDARKADGIGVLAGQKAAYLSYSVADFFTGARTMEKRKQQKMDALKADHGDAGFAAVVQFYASQK
jgi:sulfide dehydrogenase cytochrome subunit